MRSGEILTQTDEIMTCTFFAPVFRFNQSAASGVKEAWPSARPYSNFRIIYHREKFQVSGKFRSDTTIFAEEPLPACKLITAESVIMPISVGLYFAYLSP